MCGLLPCIPILGIFIFSKKKVSWDEGSGFYHIPCPGLLQITVVRMLLKILQ